jgi:hypothetical protein
MVVVPFTIESGSFGRYLYGFNPAFFMAFAAGTMLSS